MPVPTTIEKSLRLQTKRQQLRLEEEELPNRDAVDERLAALKRQQSRQNVRLKKRICSWRRRLQRKRCERGKD
jgi:hypothetical protein